MHSKDFSMHFQRSFVNTQKLNTQTLKYSANGVSSGYFSFLLARMLKVL